MYMTLPKDKKRLSKLQVIHPGQKQGVSILLKRALEKVMAFHPSALWKSSGMLLKVTSFSQFGGTNMESAL